MTIEMVLNIKPDKLSTYKKNLIQALIDDKPCGTILKVGQQLAVNVYNCEVLVYPKDEDRVLKAFQKHLDTMNGK